MIVIAGAFIGSRYYRGTVENAPKQPATNAAMIREDSHAKGPADAKVTVVEFLDPECEACAAFAPRLKNVLRDYEDRVRLVIRFVPLHQNSSRAVTFIEAAGEQGKLWQAMDMLFQKQGEWGEKHGAPPSAPKPDINALFEKYAKELGLDLDKLATATKENRYAAKLDRERKDAQTVGARQTPTVFVNGRKLNSLGEADLKAMIEEELKK